MKPQDIAQYQKAGRGFLITRNSATLADTDYEHVAKEIVCALNNRRLREERPEMKACALLLEWVQQGNEGGFRDDQTLADAVTFARLALK